MKGFMYVIQPGNDLDVVKTPLDKVPDLDMLKKAVGGWIETVPYFNKLHGEDCVAFCNEEGKLDHLPFNKHATELWYGQLVGRASPLDVLVGPVAIIQGDDELLSSL
jgi:uncharacterized protein DUF3846